MVRSRPSLGFAFLVVLAGCSQPPAAISTPEPSPSAFATGDCVRTEGPDDNIQVIGVPCTQLGKPNVYRVRYALGDFAQCSVDTPVVVLTYRKAGADTHPTGT